MEIERFEVHGKWEGGERQDPGRQRVATAFVYRGRVDVFKSDTGHNVGHTSYRDIERAWQAARAWVEEGK